MTVDVGAIEALAFRAWPAEVEEEIDGWMLRATRGLRARRINSATTPIGGATDPVAVVPSVVDWFHDRRRQPIARILSTSDPLIDRYLAAAGWTFESPTLTMTRTLAMSAGDRRVLIESSPSKRWAGAKQRLAGLAEESLAVWLRRASAISGETGYASIGDRSDVSAIGLGVVDGDWLGLFDLATDPERRRLGLANAAVSALQAWAFEKGARRAYLQVEERNGPATALYEKRGYGIAYGYWYRRVP